MSDHTEQETKKCDQLKSTETPDGENDSVEDDKPLVIDTNQASNNKSETNDNKSKIECQESKPEVSTSDNKSNETALKNNGLSKENSLKQSDVTNLENKEDEEDSSELKNKDQSNPKSSSQVDSILKKLKCTCCANNIDLYLHSMSLHPVLKVPLCETCALYYNNLTFVRDVDGKDNQCRWCAKGGDLIVCDTCHNSFCKDCVERNLGSDSLQTILDLDEDITWSCYVCDDTPLEELQKLGVEGLKINKELEKKLPTKKAPCSLTANGKLTTQRQHKEKSLSDTYCRKKFTTRDILNHIEKVKPTRVLPVLEGTKSCLQEMIASVDEALDNFNSCKTPNEELTVFNDFKSQYRYYLFNKLGQFSIIDRDEDEEEMDDDAEEEEEVIPRNKSHKSASNASKRSRPKSLRVASSEEESDDSRSPSAKRGKAAPQKRKAAQSDSESNASEQSDSDDEYSPKAAKRGRRGSGSLKKRASVGARGRKSKRNVSDSEEEDEGSDGDWKPKKKAKSRPSLNRSKSGSGGKKRGRRAKKGSAVNRSNSEEANEEKERRPKRNVDRRSMAEVDSDADINNDEEDEHLKDDEESKKAQAAN